MSSRPATSQVLAVIGRSDFRLEPVFETVVRHAVRLSHADCGYVYRPDGDVYRIAFIIGGTPKYRDYMRQHPVPHGPETLVGRVGLERRIVQIPDVLADPATVADRAGARRATARCSARRCWWATGSSGCCSSGGSRSIRSATGRSSSSTTLAAQAAIAIQNVELFQQLTRSAEELHALGEISQAVSSTLDLDEVLHTIVARAAQLSGTEGGSIFEYDAATRAVPAADVRRDRSGAGRRAGGHANPHRRHVYRSGRGERRAAAGRRISGASRPIRTSRS